MPKRDERAVKRTYRFAETLLARLETEAAKHRRAVNTQLEMIIEDWFRQQEKAGRQEETDQGNHAPAPIPA